MDTTTAMENLTSAFGSVLDWVLEILNEVIFTNPVLMVGLSIFVAGAVIALVYRMVRGG